MSTSTEHEAAGDFLHARSARGLDLFFHPTRKFKTLLFKFQFRSPLGERSPARALLPNLLRRGTRSHPTMLDVARALESLFGASWSAATYRLGDAQVLGFRLEVVDPACLPGRPALVEPALELARECLVEPVRDGAGRFPKEPFEQERLNLRREVEAQYNDKQAWAVQRLQEEMFPDDPYGRPLLGTVEQVERLTPDEVRSAYEEMRTAMPLQVFVVGDVDRERVQDWADDAFGAPAPQLPRPAPRPLRGAEQPRLVLEQDVVSQSKLVLGHAVDLADLGEREFDALRVYASVLGGGFHSRLFQSVRERHGLAYYASSSMDRIKGVLYTSCGIDAADRATVCALIEEEMESLRSAPPAPAEHEQSVRLAASSTRTVADSAAGLADALEGGLAAGRVRPLEQVARSLEAVTPADVLAAAQRVGPPAVIYCLEGEARHGA